MKERDHMEDLAEFKMDVNERDWESVDWINLSCDRRK
jgi:hypothetical protein